MTTLMKRWPALAVCSTGMLLQTGCDIADAVLGTVSLAFEIADIWT